MSEMKKAGAFVSGLILLVTIVLLVIFFFMSKSSGEDGEGGVNSSVSATETPVSQEPAKKVEETPPPKEVEEIPTQDPSTPEVLGSEVYRENYTVTNELDLTAKVLEKKLLVTGESSVKPEITLQILDESGQPKGTVNQGVNFNAYESLGVGEILEVKVSVLDKEKLVVTSLKKGS